MESIPQRLRAWAKASDDLSLYYEAADEIERLRGELANIRYAGATYSGQWCAKMAELALNPSQPE